MRTGQGEVSQSLSLQAGQALKNRSPVPTHYPPGIRKPENWGWGVVSLNKKMLRGQTVAWLGSSPMLGLSDPEARVSQTTLLETCVAL